MKIAAGATAAEALKQGLLDEIVIDQVPVLLARAERVRHFL